MEFKGKPLDIYDKVCEYLDKQKEDKEIIVVIANKDTKKIRSLSQNNTFWKLFTEIWNHLWYKKEEIHDILLGWVFGTYEITIWPVNKQMLNKPKTSELTKEEWIHFIDSILEFCKTHNIPVEITPREIQSLYNSFNY